mgnify:CR=1 FL=1
MSEKDSQAVLRGAISSIDVTEEQFDELLDDAANPALAYLDYVDVNGRTFAVDTPDFRDEAAFIKVDDDC